MSELIKFIKSILKWIILAILLVALSIGGYLGFNAYNERLVTMFALQCLYEEPTSVDDDRLRYYLIKKRNNSDIPEFIYRGVHLKSIQLSSKKEKIYKASELIKADPDKYIFKYLTFDGKHTINRKTLEINYESTSLKSKGTCELISEKVFLDKVDKIIKNQNRGNKI